MTGEISGLTLLGAPSGPLQVEVLDETDTTMSSNGTNKRAILAGLYLIEKITNSVAGEFDFSSIPAGFSRLIIKGMLRSDASANTATAQILFNSDTTQANYSRQHIYANSGSDSITEAAEPRVALITAATAAAGRYGTVKIEIEGYAGSNLKAAIGSFVVPIAAEETIVGSIGMTHDSMTAAITQLRVRTSNHPTSGLLGTLSLYGEI